MPGQGGGLSTRHAGLIQRVRDAVLESDGATAPGLRRLVEARTAALGGRPRADRPDVPPEFVSLVDKIARQAHRVTDDDITALRHAGHSEDAIFELVVSAALGAGLGRLERGLAALTGSV